MVARLDPGLQWPAPSQIPCGPWRSSDSAPSDAGEEELVSGWSAEGKNEEDTEKTRPSARPPGPGVSREGEGRPASLLLEPSQPLLTSQLILPHQVTSWSQFSCLPTLAFICSFNKRHP